MTYRRSRREIGRQIDDLSDSGSEKDHIIAFRTEEGDLVDPETGNPIDPEGVIIVLDRNITMRRKRAEEYGREILGPAEEGEDLVRVPRRHPNADESEEGDNE